MKPQSTTFREIRLQALARARPTRSGNLICALLAASLLMIAPQTHATSCTIDSVSDLAFGSYDPFASNALDVAATASITCIPDKNSATVAVAISLGTGSAGSFSPRKMQSTTDSLNYNLYADASRTQILGDGTGGTVQYIRSGNNHGNDTIKFTETLYGRIFAGQDPAVGAYTDPIVYTVNF